MATLVTIGVYGFTAETFLEALEDAGVRLVLDVRDRRGVRGAEYAWANDDAQALPGGGARRGRPGRTVRLPA